MVLYIADYLNNYHLWSYYFTKELCLTQLQNHRKKIDK